MLALSLLLLVGGHLTPFWVIVTLVRGAVKASKVTFNCTDHTAVWSRPHFNINGREKYIPQGRRLLLDFLDVADPAVLAGVDAAGVLSDNIMEQHVTLSLGKISELSQAEIYK